MFLSHLQPPISKFLLLFKYSRSYIANCQFKLAVILFVDYLLCTLKVGNFPENHFFWPKGNFYGVFKFGYSSGVWKLTTNAKFQLTISKRMLVRPENTAT